MYALDRMPWTRQIKNIATCVRTYFWVTIKLENHAFLRMNKCIRGRGQHWKVTRHEAQLSISFLCLTNKNKSKQVLNFGRPQGWRETTTKKRFFLNYFIVLELLSNRILIAICGASTKEKSKKSKIHR